MNGMLIFDDPEDFIKMIEKMQENYNENMEDETDV